MRFGGYCHFLQIHGHSLESDPYSVFNCLSVCSDDNDTKCSKLLRASLRGTSGLQTCIIIISLGQIFLSYIANTSCTHAGTHSRAHTRAHTHAHTHEHTCTHSRRHHPPHRLSLFGGAQPTVTARSACYNAGRWPFKSTHELATRFTRGFGSFSRIKKLLSRIETRTRVRMYCQTIRTVRDISRDDRARIATCSL